jgi:hypothetical protein
MGTRGAYGYRLNEEDKVTYNHFDSYPSGLGNCILEDLKNFRKKFLKRNPTGDWIEALRQKVAKIKMIKGTKDDPADSPTMKDIKKLSKWADTGVSSQSLSDWYCLMRNMQGEIIAHAQSGYMIDGVEFLKDSLFCEYAYIVNLDNETLEFYRGFNTKPTGRGRYAKLIDEWNNKKLEESRNQIGSTDNHVYYGVTFIRKYPLNELPDYIKDVRE